MSFSDKNNRVPRALVLSDETDPAPMMDMATASQPNAPKPLRWLLAGQGVCRFTLRKAQAQKKETIIQKGQSVVIRLLNSDNSDGLLLEANDNQVKLSRIGSGAVLKVLSGTNTGLIPNSNADYWLSLDSHNFYLRYGIGEARMETQTFDFQFFNEKENPDPKAKKAMRDFLESITDIQFEPREGIKPLKLLRDPIVLPVPLCIKDTDALTMMDIAQNKFLPKANLSPIAQKLYDNIAGANFMVNTPDFPQFTQAVEYSIATEGCWCYNTLDKKSEEFGTKNPKKTYLRITLGENSGESPGVPYVMEIWPPGHYSPIHNHAGANAIIKVLHGAISVKLFRFLDATQGYAVKTFSEGDITWISPDLNQIHQLKNLDNNIETCITIQCYMYDVEDKTHYDYFDYLGENEVIEHFDPDSDADFATFKKIIQDEWNAHLKDQEAQFLKGA
jgi:hypothetical protein